MSSWQLVRCQATPRALWDIECIRTSIWNLPVIGYHIYIIVHSLKGWARLHMSSFFGKLGLFDFYAQARGGGGGRWEWICPYRGALLKFLLSLSLLSIFLSSLSLSMGRISIIGHDSLSMGTGSIISQFFVVSLYILILEMNEFRSYLLIKIYIYLLLLPMKP